MKRYTFPLTIILLLFAVIALAAPGDKRPAVTSAAIGLGSSSSPTLASVTATTSVTAPSFNSTAADGYHYIRPYNAVAFAGTALAGMFVTTPTGPQWYNGSEWEAIGGGGASLPTQTGNSGKYLTTNGTTASWGSIAAGSGIAISADIPTEAGAANLNDSTHVLTVASSTGYTQFTGSYTAWDTTPDAFAFTDETDIAISTAKTSNVITVAGTNYPSSISVTGDTGYGYSKNSAACTATSGTVVAGDTVAACVTSSGSNTTATTATVTIGGVSDTYSVTTAAWSVATLVGMSDLSTASVSSDTMSGELWYSCWTASATGIAVNGYSPVSSAYGSGKYFKMAIWRRSDGVVVDTSANLLHVGAVNERVVDHFVFSGNQTITQGVEYCVGITPDGYARVYGTASVLNGGTTAGKASITWPVIPDPLTISLKRAGVLGVQVTN